MLITLALIAACAMTADVARLGPVFGGSLS